MLASSKGHSLVILRGMDRVFVQLNIVKCAA